VIAQKFKAEIFQVEWSGFGHAKQFALSKATGEWVLSIDADEELSPELAEEVRRITTQSGTVDGYDMPRLTNFLGKWIYHCGWYPDRVLRLFRRTSGRFTTDIVHERVVVDGKVGRCAGHLFHYSYPSLEVYFEKFNRYTTVGAELEASRGKTAGAIDLTIRPGVAFIKHYVSKAGFLDGIEGLMISTLSSAAVFVKYAKLYARNRRKSSQ
jgi:glycosyltransferase involved in cell wall biosynthesis